MYIFSSYACAKFQTDCLKTVGGVDYNIATQSKKSLCTSSISLLHLTVYNKFQIDGRSNYKLVVYAHGHRLCSNWFRH